jgi:hypothetical protein
MVSWMRENKREYGEHNLNLNCESSLLNHIQSTLVVNINNIVSSKIIVPTLPMKFAISIRVL